MDLGLDIKDILLVELFKRDPDVTNVTKDLDEPF
jgi:hypothetical protein